MTMRWRHPPELERQRARERFDPVREGDRHRLSREVSIAIWERVCREASDGRGQLDVEQAERRFHEIAALVAARGGRLLPEIGRYTRVGVELGGMPLAAWHRELLPRPAPGRETLVTRAEAERAAEARQDSAREAREEAATSDAGGRGHRAVERSEDPAVSEVAQLMAALQRPPAGQTPTVLDLSAGEPPMVLDRSELRAGRRVPRAGLAAWSVPGRDREPRDGQLPAATRARMEQAYGQRFDDVEIHVDSAEVPAGHEAFTRGRHIYFERGAFDPDSEHGEHVIAHELAHVAQQSRPGSDGGPVASRAALEADAHQAALAALAGRAASVNLFAPASAALAFSDGEAPERPGGAPGASGRAPAQTARGAGPAPSGGAAPGTGGAGHGGGSAGSTTRAPGGSPSGTSARPGETPVDRPAAAPPGGGAPPAAAAPPRREAGGDLLMPEAPSALSPGAAGRLQAVHGANRGVAAATTELPTAQQQTDVARAAVVEPQAEQDAHAQHDVVATVDDRPPPSPEIEQACARIRQVIRDKRPPSEDKLVEAKPKEMAQAAGEEMSAGVEQRAGSVRQGYADMQQQPRGTPDTTPVPATLPPQRAQTEPVNAAAGAPDPLKHDDVSLDSDLSAQKQKVQDAGMNTEPGQLVKDGPIGDARGGVDDLQTMAKTDPQKVLADQAAAVAHAQGDMRALQAAAEKALAEARAGAVGHMATHTTTVKGSEEQQRAAAGAQMQAVFTRTQQTVDRLLQPLSGNAVARWEAGVAQLSTEFENSLAQVKQKIDERHSGIGGFFTELGDDVFGLPDWVTADYDIAEARFADGATRLITDISRDVNQVIEDCKKLIDQARKDIEAIVHSLPASLQTWAQGEASRLGQQLDQLSQKVDQTQKGLNQDLINRANGAVQQVRERVADLREQAKGLLGKIADAIAEFIKDPARAIVNGLLRLVGIPPASFWALVDKLGNVISGIAADPMKFANTLMSGVGQGFQQFFHNLPTHLGQSLFQWLFSKMADVGVQMPVDFSIPSILTLVLEVMGISWTRIKAILAKHIGDKNAEVLDQAYQLINTLIQRGPLGVYHLVQEHLDPGMIMDAIKNAAISYVMEAIITRVAARIIMMLNPAGAILQAIEAIYRVIKWVIDNAARIFTLIEAVVNGAAQILAGNVSGVANLVERALGLLLVPVIDFLADYLGLGGIPEALKKVIMGLQSRVEQILDKVIGFLVDKARALWQAIKSKVKGKDADTKGREGRDKSVEALQVDHVGQPQEFTSGEEAHHLWAEKKGTSFVLMVASTPQELSSLLDSRRVRQLSKADDQLQADVTQARQILTMADGSIAQIMSAARASDAAEEKQHDAQLDGQMRALVAPLKRIMFKVSTSRKPASIDPLFQLQNQVVPFGSPEWEYGPQLKAKLEQFAAAIADALSATMSKEMRSELIEAIRTGKRWGGLKRWTVSAGAIYAPFVAAQSAAVDALAPEAQRCDIVLSLERGGALAQDELLSGMHQPSQVIPKRTMTTVEIDAAVQLGHLSEDERKVLVAPGTHGKHKVQQQADLRAKIDELMASDPAQAMTIAIAETRVGGGSVDGLVKSAKAALATGRYPNLKFKILALDQTMHRDEENAAQGVTYLPVAGAAGKIQVVISSTPYILGEDVAVQLSRTGKAPVIVFNATEDRIAAYRITPQSDTVTRDIILDLVDGAYNAFLPGVV